VSRPDRRSTPGAPLTPRQAAVLSLIYATIEAQGRRPTFREIMGLWGLRSTQGVTNYMRSLERKGYVRLHPTAAGRPRPFDLLRRPDGSPFLGFLPVGRGPPDDTDRNQDQP
jgi:SOS-response transcriptional repressor LexA